MSFLEQLENNEAILLMYLAGELPPQDQAEVAEMLANDATLRADLEKLRVTYDRVRADLHAADRDNAPGTAQIAASHRVVMRSMRQWALEFPTRVVEQPKQKGLRYPWWTYPIAASIAIFFAFLAWWGNTEPNIRPQDQHQEASIRVDEGLARRLDSSLALSDDFNRTQEEADSQIAFYRQGIEDDSPLIPF